MTSCLAECYSRAQYVGLDNRMILPSLRLPSSILIFSAFLASALAGCESPRKKNEEEAARNTFACLINGERLVIRFAEGEVRLLMPDAQRVTLHQIPTGSGVRYSNGHMELRGKGMDLVFTREAIASPLQACAPYTPPVVPAK